MTARIMEVAATETHLLVGIAPFVVGVVIAVALIAAVWFGIKVRRREPAPPRREEQPRRPEAGPAGGTTGYREPNEVPRGEDRLTAHEFNGHGNLASRPGEDRRRRRWSSSGGGFGSGGPGSTR